VLKRLIAAVVALVTMAALTVTMAAPASASYQHTCFGYTGTFMDPVGPYPTEASLGWAVGGDNCIGISPGRQIWITSAGHPWAVIPGDGRADGVLPVWDEYRRNDYGKFFQVWVASSNSYWCQSWWSDTGWASNWWSCTLHTG